MPKISLDPLIKLYGKDVNDANDFIIEKGWTFLGVEDMNSSVIKRVSWSWNPDSNNKKKAYKFINYIFDTNEIRPASVFVQTHSSNEYTQMRKEIDSFGMKKIYSELQYDAVIADFEGKNFVVRTVSWERENEPTTYLFVMYNKHYYRNTIVK